MGNCVIVTEQRLELGSKGNARGTGERGAIQQEIGLLQSVAGWDNVPAVRDGRVYVTDGASYFSRPGPRLVDSLELLAHVIHPDVHALPAWVQPPVRVDQHVGAAR